MIHSQRLRFTCRTSRCLISVGHHIDRESKIETERNDSFIVGRKAFQKDEIGVWKSSGCGCGRRLQLNLQTKPARPLNQKKGSSPSWGVQVDRRSDTVVLRGCSTAGRRAGRSSYLSRTSDDSSGPYSLWYVLSWSGEETDEKRVERGER